MSKEKNISDYQIRNAYDDGNIPRTDLPAGSNSADDLPAAEPLPESFRPRKDGPGGD